MGFSSRICGQTQIVRLRIALLALAAAALYAFGNSPASAAELCENCVLSDNLVDQSGTTWRSETLHEALQKQLKTLGNLLAQPESLDHAQLASLAEPKYAGTALLPHKIVEAMRDSKFTVVRGKAGGNTTLEHEGLAGLKASLSELLEPLAGASEVRAKFKTFRIAEQPATHQATTTAYVELIGSAPSGDVEIHATWHCRWSLPAEDEQQEQPRLLEIRLADYERVESRAGQLLADCTSAVLGQNPTFDEQIRRGTNHWMNCLDYRAGVDLQGHQGLAVGDVNGDGLDDVYLCQNGALPNRLYVQNADGTATERSAEAKLDLLMGTKGALLLDLDNDNDQDLVLSVGQNVLFLENDGAAHFRMRADWRGPARLFSLSAADYDQDGDLDIYACGLVEIDERPVPVPYHDANNGGRNALLANEGSWNFRDVTDEVGLSQNNTRFSYASSWEDYDNDGDQDLYVANDFGRNNLYRNDGGTFVDVAAAAGVEDLGAGMSATWGDANGDGLVDLYVSNMFSSAGGRIAFQQQFGGEYSEQDKKILQRHARGNTLLINHGDGTFRDVSEAAHVTMGRWAWASSFADLNNDGREDLLVANGYITGEDTKDL